MPAVEGYGSIESLVLVDAFSWFLSNAQGAFGTVSVMPESAGTGASFCLEIGAIADSTGAVAFVVAFVVAFLAVNETGVKSADSTAPAVEASSDLLATDELEATTSYVVFTVTFVPLLTVVVVFVASVTLEEVFDDKVPEIVAASSSTTVDEFVEVDAFADAVTFSAVVVAFSAAGVVAFSADVVAFSAEFAGVVELAEVVSFSAVVSVVVF